jgi:CheY-like chemotaxis protein/PAS domain-containing protein
VQFPLDDIALQGAAMPNGILELVSDALGAGLLIYDAEDQILFASKRIEQFFSISPAYLQRGVPLRDVFGAYYDSRKAADPAFAQQKHSMDRAAWIADNLAAHWKERCESEDRLPGKRWLRIARRRLAGGLGICVISDISERKRSEYQWRADIERVQVIEEMLDRLHFPITVTDQNHIYVGVNKAACQFMQKSIDTIVGRSVTDLHVSELASRIESDNIKVLESGRPLNVPERIGMPSGEEQLFVTHKVRVGKPGMHFVLSCMQDITSFAQVGTDGALSVIGHEQLEFVSSPANAGIKIEDTVGEVPRVLLVCSDQALALEAKARLNRCGMEADFVTSRAQVRAVLDVCKSSSLWLDLVLVCEEFDQSMVSDITSIGLRVERISLREVETTITDIVCTTLNVRCAQCRTGDRPAHHKKDCSLCDVQFVEPDYLDVVVAEDNPINQVVFAQILDSLKLKYRIVGTGQELLAILSTNRPGAVFIDTTLPDMDGYSAVRSIRAIEAQQSLQRLPIIGVVALAFDGDRAKCLASGMDDMLLKPLSPDMLEQILHKNGRNTFKHSKINIRQY